MKSKIIMSILFIAVALPLIPNSADAHGSPEITVAPDTVAAGGKITVKGETMGANEEFTISLEGLKFKADLGDVKSNDKEEFEVQFTIPADAPAGVYIVKAVGKDGDMVTAELTVTAPVKTPTPVSGQVQPTPQPTEQPMPSAAEHAIPRSRTPLEVIGLFTAVEVSAGVGLLLVHWK